MSIYNNRRNGNTSYNEDKSNSNNNYRNSTSIYSRGNFQANNEVKNSVIYPDLLSDSKKMKNNNLNNNNNKSIDQIRISENNKIQMKNKYYYNKYNNFEDNDEIKTEGSKSQLQGKFRQDSKDIVDQARNRSISSKNRNLNVNFKDINRNEILKTTNNKNEEKKMNELISGIDSYKNFNNVNNKKEDIFSSLYKKNDKTENNINSVKNKTYENKNIPNSFNTNNINNSKDYLVKNENSKNVDNFKNNNSQYNENYNQNLRENNFNNFKSNFMNNDYKKQPYYNNHEPVKLNANDINKLNKLVYKNHQEEPNKFKEKNKININEDLLEKAKQKIEYSNNSNISEYKNTKNSDTKKNISKNISLNENINQNFDCINFGNLLTSNKVNNSNNESSQNSISHKNKTKNLTNNIFIDEIFNQNSKSIIIENNINIPYLNKDFNINYINNDEDSNTIDYEKNLNEINNKKIFYQENISKCNSEDLNDYIHIKDNIIDEKKLKDFYNILDRKYEKQTEKFSQDLRNYDFSNKTIEYNKVGPVSFLENYLNFKFSDFIKENKIISQIDLLERNIFRWRNVSGDGNCFYRAVFFSYMENILIEKDDLFFLNFIFDFYNLIQDIEVKKNFIKNNIDVDKIVRFLFFILDMNLKKLNDLSKLESFIILINNCKEFDLGLILYLRLKIYQFIENNKNKIYSKEFNVKLGNLLSEKYEGDGENFLWKEFYEENLLKLHTEAENIIIYVTPMILKINLRIFTYDIGFENSDKCRDISCQLENKHTVFVFYRKIHYDIIYSKEYFEKIHNNVNNYVDVRDKRVNIEYLKKQVQNSINECKNENNDNESIMKNDLEFHLSDSKNKNSIKVIKNEEKNKFEIEKKIDNCKIKDNLYNYVTEDYYYSLLKTINNENEINIECKKNEENYIEKNTNTKQNFSFNQFICENCKNISDLEFAKKINYPICENCFIIELKSIISIEIINIIELKFNEFLNNKNSNFVEFSKIFKDKERLTIYGNQYNLIHLEKILPKKIDDIIRETRAETCIICLNDDKSCTPKNLIHLPCSCTFKSNFHLEIFLKKIIKFNKIYKHLFENYVCLCGFKYKMRDILEIFEILNEYKLVDIFYEMKDFVTEDFFKAKCFLCEKKITKNFQKIILTDDLIKNGIHLTSYEHLYCKDCSTVIKNKKHSKNYKIDCKICGYEHMIESY